MLGANPLGSLPERIGELHELRELYVHECKLVRLPESIGALTRLHTLDLGHNELTSLPSA